MTVINRASSRRSHHQARRRLASASSLLILCVTALVVLVPFLWMLSLAFTPEKQAFGAVSLIPTDPTLDNFKTAFVTAKLARALLNSGVVSIIAIVSNCLFAVAAGYSFAMLKFPGSRTVFYILISTAAVPVSVTLIPLFLIARGIPLTGGNDIFGNGGSGVLDTLAGVVLPYIVLPLNIFLARQFFASSPTELAEAARVDGAGEFRIFFRIYWPLAKPLIAVIAVFSFTSVWDDFLWPLVVTTSQNTQTVQLALARFLASGNIQYAAVMAGAVLATVPVLIVFLFNQRSFISGLADGSVKG